MTIFQRLLCISGSFLLPISVLLYLMLAGIQERIEFASLEKQGNAYQRPLEKTLHGLLQHRWAVVKTLEGDKTAQNAALREEEAVDSGLRAVELIHKSLGDGLQFHPEGLGKRKRDDANNGALVRGWGSLRRSLNGATLKDFRENSDHLLKKVRTMITHLGDTSNLILDPDLDSFYLMDVTLVALPQAQHRIGDILLLYQELVKAEKGREREEIKKALVGQLALFREADADRVIASANTSLMEDETFFGKSELLQKELPGPLEKFSKSAEKLEKLLSDSKTLEANAADPKIAEAGHAALDASFALWDTAVHELDRLLEIRISKFKADRVYAFLLSFLALAFSCLLVWYIGKGITTPIHATRDRLEKLVQGDLIAETRVFGQGELAEMSSSLAKAISSSHHAISSITANSKTLLGSATQQKEVSRMMASNSAETSSQASLIASSAEEVSTNIRTVAAAAEEMGATIREIARQSQQAVQVAFEAVRIAETGNRAVLRLGENSAIIGNVVKFITSIAEQTNLLALNASIEAARAGEFGKGFAVVASEVKELARETAKATDDIRSKIQGIQADTLEAVGSNERTREIISKIHEIQNTIASAVEEQVATTREITRNVADAAIGSGEIARNIVGLAEAATNTSRGAANLDQAAQGLDSMARELQTLVQAFKISPATFRATNL